MCLAYFIGQGYSDGFSAHMAQVLALLETGRQIRLSCDTDIVCTACPNNCAGICHKPEMVDRFDRSVLSLCSLKEGDILLFSRFAALVERHILGPGMRERICGTCQWSHLCTTQPSRWAGSLSFDQPG